MKPKVLQNWTLVIKKQENVEENQTLAKFRDTLLPKFISGEIDLKDVAVDNPIVEAILD